MNVEDGGERNSPRRPTTLEKCHSSPRGCRSLLQRNRIPVLFAYLTPRFFFAFWVATDTHITKNSAISSRLICDSSLWVLLGNLRNRKGGTQKQTLFSLVPCFHEKSISPRVWLEGRHRKVGTDRKAANPTYTRTRVVLCFRLDRL